MSAHQCWLPGGSAYRDASRASSGSISRTIAQTAAIRAARAAESALLRSASSWSMASATRRRADSSIEHTVEDYQVGDVFGGTYQSPVIHRQLTLSVEKRCGSSPENPPQTFSSTQPVDHIFPVHDPRVGAGMIISTVLSPGCAQRSRRVCTLCPHPCPRCDLVPGVAGRQNVSAVGYNGVRPQQIRSSAACRQQGCSNGKGTG